MSPMYNDFREARNVFRDWRGPFILHGWVAKEMARLPWEKVLGETPQGVKRRPLKKSIFYGSGDYF